VFESVIVTYKTVQDLEEAVGVLAASNFPIEQISVVAKDLDSQTQVHAFATSGFINRAPIGKEMWLEGVFSMLIGAAFFWTPKFGQVIIVGPLAEILLTEFAADANRINEHPLASLANWSVPIKNIAHYENLIKKGEFLLITHGHHEQVMTSKCLLDITKISRLDPYCLLAFGSEENEPIEFVNNRLGSYHKN
jgi:hypothetical protein